MKNNQKIKVLFAAVDIGWRIEHYSKFIRDNFSDQLETDSFVNYHVPGEHYNTEYTFSYSYNEMGSIKRWILSAYNFIRLIFRYDVFHFFSGETLLTRNTRAFEFFVYKLFRKRIVMHFVGADIRNPEYIYQKAENIVEIIKRGNREIELLPWQSKLIQDSKRFAHTTFVSTPDLLHIYGKEAQFLPVFLDFKKFKKEIDLVPIEKNKKIIRILHAPSNPLIKGTKHIIKAIEEIKSENIEGVEFVIPDHKTYELSQYSLSRYDLFKEMKSCDIVIDQLIIGWYGLQALEAIMCENVVLSYIENDLNKYLDKDCPIVNANAINIKDKILAAINLVKSNSYDFEAAKEWAEDFHGIKRYKFMMESAWIKK